MSWKYVSSFLVLRLWGGSRLCTKGFGSCATSRQAAFHLNLWVIIEEQQSEAGFCGEAWLITADPMDTSLQHHVFIASKWINLARFTVLILHVGSTSSSFKSKFVDNKFDELWHTTLQASCLDGADRGWTDAQCGGRDLSLLALCRNPPLSEFETVWNTIIKQDGTLQKRALKQTVWTCCCVLNSRGEQMSRIQIEEAPGAIVTD